MKSIIEGSKRASLSDISFDEGFAKADAVEIEEPLISDPRLASLISSVLSAFVREHVRAVSVWEKDHESAGLSTAAIILREGQSAIESVLKEALRQRSDLEQPAFTNLVQRYLKPNEASMLADRIASALRMELASKQALLEILNPAERLEKLLTYLSALS